MRETALGVSRRRRCGQNVGRMAEREMARSPGLNSRSREIENEPIGFAR